MRVCVCVCVLCRRFACNLFSVVTQSICPYALLATYTLTRPRTHTPTNSYRRAGYIGHVTKESKARNLHTHTPTNSHAHELTRSRTHMLPKKAKHAVCTRARTGTPTNLCCTDIYRSECLCVCVCVCVCVYIDMCVRVCIYAYYICIYICIYIYYVYVCMYICTYVYIHKHTQNICIVCI